MWTDLTTLFFKVLCFCFFVCGKFAPADMNARNFLILKVLPQAADS